MLAHNLLVLAALTATAAPVPPQDASGLRWKFEKGRTFYQEQTTQTVQTMSIGGSDVKQTQSQTLVISWTPEKEDGDRSPIAGRAGRAGRSLPDPSRQLATGTSDGLARANKSPVPHRSR